MTVVVGLGLDVAVLYVSVCVNENLVKEYVGVAEALHEAQYGRGLGPSAEM